jgi:hypothetical protein
LAARYEMLTHAATGTVGSFTDAKGHTSTYTVSNVARSQRQKLGCPERVRPKGTGAGTSCPHNKGR